MNIDSITVRELIRRAMDDVDDDGDVIGVTNVISDNPKLMDILVPFTSPIVPVISPIVDMTMTLSNRMIMNDILAGGRRTDLNKVKVWTNEHVYVLNHDNEAFYVDVVDDGSVPEVMMESIAI